MDFKTAQRLYGGLKEGDFRAMALNDLYFLLRYVLRRDDLERAWVYDRCREVQAQPDGRLDLWARDHYKSTVITFGLTIQDVLNDPETTIGIFSFTRSIAKDFLGQIKREFENNVLLNQLFPDILWGVGRKGPVWNDNDGLIVRRRKNPKEATVEAWGLDYQPTGKHFRVLVYDDIVTRESVFTAEANDKLLSALEMSFNLGQKGGVKRFVGTRYHQNDLYAELLKRGAAVPRVRPATDDGTLAGAPVLLSPAELERKKAEMGPYVFSCQMLQAPTPDNDTYINALDYKLRDWQADALAKLGEKRFGVIVAHRRAGKTEVTCLRLLLAAMRMRRFHPSPLFAYVAPYLNQAKAVAWDRLKFYTAPLMRLPGFRLNESELSLTLWNGATIRLFGSDYPDRLRGLGFDGVVMDEVAQMRPDTWGAVVRPALSDRAGWALFIGTPKAQNMFFELYQGAASGKLGADWVALDYPVTKTGVISEEEVATLRVEMSEDLFRQEYLCDFTASNNNTFMPFDLVQGAATAQDGPVDARGPLVLGVDVARFGDDRTVVVARRGQKVLRIEAWRQRDLMYTASNVAAMIERAKPQAVFVDGCGLGGGVVDRLRQLGHHVINVNAGAKPSRPDKYCNLKAEMWAKMKDWLRDGGRIPDDTALKNDLLAPMYEFDANGRLKIEGKDELKKRGFNSPDVAEALSLTFAMPVAHPELAGRRPSFAEMD